MPSTPWPDTRGGDAGCRHQATKLAGVTDGSSKRNPQKCMPRRSRFNDAPEALQRRGQPGSTTRRPDPRADPSTDAQRLSMASPSVSSKHPMRFGRQRGGWGLEVECGSAHTSQRDSTRPERTRPEPSTNRRPRSVVKSRRQARVAGEGSGGLVHSWYIGTRRRGSRRFGNPF